MEDNKNLNIQTMLPKYFTGELDVQSRQIVEEWIQADDEHRAIAEQMRDIYRATDTLYAMREVDEESVLCNLHTKMRRQSLVRLVRIIERVAAILILPILIFSGIQLYQSMQDTDEMVQLTTNPGMIGSTLLSDGTSVKLNSSTTIIYPREFSGDERKVNINGEAYFHVAKDKHHPFVVHTANHADIMVYGTHFNVEAYNNDDFVKTTLEEGSVSVRYSDADGKWAEKRIVPGQMALYSVRDHSMEVKKTDVDVVISWKDGILIFRNTSAGDVLNSIAKRYNVQFIVNNTKCMGNRFTGKIEQQRLDKILDFLSMMSNMHFRYITGDKLKTEKQRIVVY